MLWRSGNAVVCKTTMHGFDSHQHLKNEDAQVAELAYAEDLKSSAARLVGSTPTLGKPVGNCVKMIGAALLIYENSLGFGKL